MTNQHVRRPSVAPLRMLRAGYAVLPVSALLLSIIVCPSLTGTTVVYAADEWNPFAEAGESYEVKPKRKLPSQDAVTDPSEPYPGADGQPPPPLVPSTVERNELTPIEPPPEPAAPGPVPGQLHEAATSTVPNGRIDHHPSVGPRPAIHTTRTAASLGPPQPLDEKLASSILATDLMPNRSTTLTGLWYQQMNRIGQGASQTEIASRFEALWRSGFPTEAAAILQAASGDKSPLISALRARSDVGLGHTDTGCEAARFANESRDTLPKPMLAELILHAGFCGAVSGNPQAAGAIAELAREQSMGDQDTVAFLAAIAKGSKPRMTSTRTLTPLALRIAHHGNWPLGPEVAAVGTPPALSILTSDTTVPALTTAAAAEQAARFNLIPLSRLASAYRKAAGEGNPVAIRASRFVAAETERSPLQKTRLIRAFLDSARRDRLYRQALLMSAPMVERIPPAPEIGWFAETAIEVLTAAGQYGAARRWANVASAESQQGPQAVGHWLALIDIADPATPSGQGIGLDAVEALALQGKFDGPSLHRLATILDALDYNVPMRLWEAASRTPQPTSGHLPETGVLKEIQDAARTRDLHRLALLAIKSIGRDGGEGANILALGDTLRSLRRAGLDAEARHIAFETLLPIWPHTAN